MLYHKIFKCQTDESKPFIVLLHGFGGNHRVWKYQIPLLQQYFNVLAIDLPSHNDENLKLTKMKNDIESISKEIIFVLDTYNVNNAIFMAVSLGTVFVKYLEMYYPQYIDYGIMVGAVCAVGTFLTATVNLFSIIGDKLPFSIVYNIFSKVLMPSKNSKQSRRVFIECAKALNRYEFKAWMNIFKENFSLSEKYLHSISNSKNLYIAGTFDFCFLKGIRREAIGTNGRLIIFKHCGHICNIDQKIEFNSLLSNEFLHQKINTMI